jgi:hypothetical protein
MSRTNHLCLCFLTSLLLLSSCTFFKLIPHAKAETWTWIDDFTDQNSRWNWGYSRGTGYHLLTNIDGYSAVENGITAATTQYAYSDCALTHYPGTISQSQLVTIEIRAKFSHSMLQTGAKGSQGLIIWNGMTNFAGFFDCSVETETGFAGLRAIVMSNGEVYANQYVGDTYDPRNWHVYRIVLKSDGTALYVDGNLVAQTTQRPYSLAEVNLWVDNAAYALDGSVTNLDVTEDQKLYVDRVAWSDSVILPTPTTSPEPTPTPSPSSSPSAPPTPTPTPIHTTPTPTPTLPQSPSPSASHTPSPEPTDTIAEISPEIFAAAFIGATIIIAIALIFLGKRGK